MGFMRSQVRVLSPRPSTHFRRPIGALTSVSTLSYAFRPATGLPQLPHPLPPHHTKDDAHYYYWDYESRRDEAPQRSETPTASPG